MPPTRRTNRPQTATPVGDDGGCLLLLLVALWFFGFVTFHSRERGRAIARMEHVSTELKKAESQLTELTNVLNTMRSETAELTEERRALQRQVVKLERVRTDLAASLSAAHELVNPVRPGLLETLRRWLLGNVLGSIAAAILAAPIIWYLPRLLRSALLRLRRHAADDVA